MVDEDMGMPRRNYCKLGNQNNILKNNCAQNNINVLLIYDCPNWAFHGQAKGLVNNTKLNINYDICGIKNLYQQNINKYDIIFPIGTLSASFEIYNRYFSHKPYVTLMHHYPWSQEFRTENITAEVIQNEIAFIKKSQRHASISKRIQKIWLNQFGIESYYLPSGIDCSKFKPVDKIDDKIILGWVGNMNKPIKNFYNIVQPAVRNIQSTSLNVEFKVKGFDNLITHDKMAYWYHGIDLYLCASSCEGLPTPLVEACACGIPFVSTDVGVASEINIHGLNMIVERNIDAFTQGIMTMITNKERLKKAGKLNRKVIEAGWSWDIVAYIWEYFIVGQMDKFNEMHERRTKILNDLEGGF